MVDHKEKEQAFGLQVLFEPSPEVSQDHEIIDIVAVHGLMGHRVATWTHEETGKMWLQDFLPSKIPNARIMTYGYDANPRSKTKIGIFGNAQALVQAVKIERLETGKRRLLFVAHSLGGLIVKKALLLAQQQKDSLFNATYGVMFMGTPHSGSSLANFVLHLTKFVTPITHISDTLLKELKMDSKSLTQLTYDFSYVQLRFHYVSVREANETKSGFGSTLVVEEHSSRLNLGPFETEFPIPGADHIRVCKFKSEDEPGLKLVLSHLKMMADAAAKPIAKPDKCNHFMVPHKVSSHFLGRDEELKALEKAFLGSKNRTRRAALWGMGGVGKTQLAYHYCNAHKGDYAAVFFITSSTISDMKLRYRGVYNELLLHRRVADDVEGQISEVQRWLNENENWLIVYDDVQNDLYEKFMDLLPTSRKCHILMTTRSQRTANSFVNEPLGDIVLQVEPMSPDNAVDLLLRAGSQPLDNQSLRKTAAEVAKTLGYVPMAMEFVGRGYSSQEALEGLLGTFGDTEALREFVRVHKDEIVGYKQETSFRFVFDTTMKKLTDEEKHLWYVTAFLNPTWISLHLFIKLPQETKASLRALASSPEETGNRLAHMRDLGLMNLTEGKDDYWIHDFMMFVNQNSLGDEGNLEFSDDAARWILAGFPESYGDFATWKYGTHYLTHARSCSKRSRELNVHPLRLGKLLYNASNFARFVALYDLAETLACESLELFEKYPELADEDDISLAKDSLGIALRRQSKWDEAEKVFKANLAFQEAKYGCLHKLTLTTVNELGWMYVLRGVPEEGESWLRRAVEGREEAFGTDHGPTQHSWQNLAACLTKLGRLEEAEHYYTRALAGHEKKFGPLHVWVLHIKSNIVDLREAQQRYSDASDLCTEVWDGRKRLPRLGETHPDTMRAACKLIHLLNEQSLYSKAQQVGWECYGAWEKLGEHEEALGVLDWISDTRKRAGLPPLSTPSRPLLIDTGSSLS